MMCPVRTCTVEVRREVLVRHRTMLLMLLMVRQLLMVLLLLQVPRTP